MIDRSAAQQTGSRPAHRRSLPGAPAHDVMEARWPRRSAAIHVRSDPHPREPITVLGKTVDIERLTYATVVLMSVLAVYDGWSQLATFLGAALVTVAPVLALVTAHLFADVLAEHAQRGRRLSGREWLGLIVDQFHLFLVTAPPLAFLLLGWLLPWDAVGTITAILWAGVLTLVLLATLAAHRAGIRSWRLVAAGLLGGVAGLVVIVLQLLLKPH